MKTLVFIILAIIALLLVSNISAEQLEPCPAGTTDTGLVKNGVRLCKIDPTGCPYGDSIPIEDCDKYEPIQEQTTENTIVESDLIFEGK